MNIKDAILKAVLRERKRLFEIGRSELVLDDVDRIVDIVKKTGIRKPRMSNVR